MLIPTLKTRVLATLLLASCACVLSVQGYAQQATHNPLTLKLGTAFITGKKPVSADQVLTYPRLVFTDTSWHIQSFTLSFQPHGKDYIGPFATNGYKLTQKEIDVFTQLKENGPDHTRVFFEDIKAYGPDGQERSLSPVIFNLVKE